MARISFNTAAFSFIRFLINFVKIMGKRICQIRFDVFVVSLISFETISTPISHRFLELNSSFLC